LGYLIGDGTLAGTTPRFTTADPALRDDVAELVKPFGATLRHKGNLEYSIISEERTTQAAVAAKLGISQSTVSLVLAGKPGPSHATRESVLEAIGDQTHGRLSANQVTEWLRSFGLWGRTARDKFIPRQVFEQPRHVIAALLNRLYATDGSASVSGPLYRVEYCTISKQLARDVQHLLLRFGIQAKLRVREIAYDSK